jgi:hypothetical protein
MSNQETNPHDISLAEAAQLTKNFRDTHQSPDTVIAQKFNKAAIMDILNQTGCCGIRVYYAQDTAGAPKMVFTGVDVNGNDMYTGKLAQHGQPCPSSCSTSNPLNC